jgi:SPP1 gp7 family putative phage head morphogenesis protein
MQDLIPFLDAKYGQNIRHARNVAHDQTRKAFTNISTARLKAAGVKKFEWRHSHGGRTPRKLHEELNGKVFSYDDPPYIGDMYGQKVYGLPSQMPNCRCFAKPIIDFGDEE